MNVGFYPIRNVEAALQDLPSITCVHKQEEVEHLFLRIGHAVDIGIPFFPRALLLVRDGREDVMAITIQMDSITDLLAEMVRESR